MSADPTLRKWRIYFRVTWIAAPAGLLVRGAEVVFFSPQGGAARSRILIAWDLQTVHVAAGLATLVGGTLAAVFLLRFGRILRGSTSLIDPYLCVAFLIVYLVVIVLNFWFQESLPLI